MKAMFLMGKVKIKPEAKSKGQPKATRPRSARMRAKGFMKEETKHLAYLYDVKPWILSVLMNELRYSMMKCLLRFGQVECLEIVNLTVVKKPVRSLYTAIVRAACVLARLCSGENPGLGDPPQGTTWGPFGGTPGGLPRGPPGGAPGDIHRTPQGTPPGAVWGIGWGLF